MKMSEDIAVIWNCGMEVNLFHALRGHKPVGVSRHFHMISIHEKMLRIYKNIKAKQIWNFLGELWNLNILNESEIIPFPNKEAEFMLPESDFAELMNKAFPRFVLPQEEMKSEVMSEKDDIQNEDKTEKHKDEKIERHKDEKTENPKEEKSERLKEDKAQKHKDENGKSDSAKAPKSESRPSTSAGVNNTPGSSTKRKRTRQQAPSPTASPATPDASPIKRKR